MRTRSKTAKLSLYCKRVKNSTCLKITRTTVCKRTSGCKYASGTKRSGNCLSNTIPTKIPTKNNGRKPCKRSSEEFATPMRNASNNLYKNILNKNIYIYYYETRR